MANYWEIAKEMEKEGRKFYKKLADESELKELKGVFNFLAQQEEGHYKAFCQLEGDEEIPFEEKVDAVQKAREIFSKVVPDFSVPSEINVAAETYKKARTLELSAVKYYSSLLESADSEKQKRVLKQIIKEEESHAQVLDALIDFISRPNEWLENAEFTHLDAY